MAAFPNVNWPVGLKLGEYLRDLLYLINQSTIFWECLLMTFSPSSPIIGMLFGKSLYGKLVRAGEWGNWSISSLGECKPHWKWRQPSNTGFLCKNIRILEKNKAQCLSFHTEDQRTQINLNEKEEPILHILLSSHGNLSFSFHEGSMKKDLRSLGSSDLIVFSS